MFKPSKNPQVEELTKNYKDRQFNLTDLKVIKTESGRFCAWCTETKLHHGNQKYCSEVCSRSAMAWAYPQKEDNLGALLIRQNYKCNICQFDYVPFMDQVASTMRGTMERDWRNHFMWYFYKRLKSAVPKDRKPEVDHIVPIYKGGASLGLDNHQAICYSCHKRKTSVDLSGKRKK